MALRGEVIRLLRPPRRRVRSSDEAEARDLQLSLLSADPPQLEGFEIACALAPSQEVSGDSFDVFPLGDDTMALSIADVSGKGMDAALLTREMHATVRSLAPAAASPAELCTAVNRAMRSSLAPEKYITLFYAMLDRQRRLRYENAGHCLPLLVRADGSIELPASFSGVIGIFSHWLYQDQELQLRSGDRLLLLTDGLLLAENSRHQEFGYQRLIRQVEIGRGESAASLCRQILAAVTRHAGGKLRDDASLIVVLVE